MRHDQHTFLRYSIGAFNDQSDLDILYAALQEILETTTLIHK
jgi:isopenicillin-N epimerase